MTAAAWQTVLSVSQDPSHCGQVVFFVSCWADESSDTWGSCLSLLHCEALWNKWICNTHCVTFLSKKSIFLGLFYIAKAYRRGKMALNNLCVLKYWCFSVMFIVYWLNYCFSCHQNLMVWENVSPESFSAVDFTTVFTIKPMFSLLWSEWIHLANVVHVHVCHAAGSDCGKKNKISYGLASHKNHELLLSEAGGTADRTEPRSCTAFEKKVTKTHMIEQVMFIWCDYQMGKVKRVKSNQNRIRLWRLTESWVSLTNLFLETRKPWEKLFNVV